MNSLLYAYEARVGILIISVMNILTDTVLKREYICVKYVFMQA
jgi:hypothetical protein